MKKVGEIVGYIYFIQDTKSKNIKIGYSKNDPFKRFFAIQTGNPYKLKLIAVIEGNQRMEKSLHILYSHLNVSGEWFREDVLRILTTAKTLNLEELKSHINSGSESSVKEREEIFLTTNLRHFFKDVNLSAVARNLKISKSLLADWISYRRKPSVNNMHCIYKICKSLNVSFEDLFFKDLRL